MASRILYYLIIYPISLLPHFLLYRISDLMYLIMYYLVGYRKKVITDNINQSYPSKSKQELKTITKEFYRHFCDLVVESIKNFSINEKKINARVTFENPEVIDQYYDQGKSVITIGGHYCNWEMFAVAVDAATKHKQIGIYKPLADKFFDKKMRESRSKYGLLMIPMKTTKSYFQNDNETPVSLIFGSDQWPSNPRRAYWTSFLGRETPFLFGAEKYAKEFNWPVVYCELKKVKRGHITARYHKLCDDPSSMQEGEIIQKFVCKLENTLSANPAHWLWSHKRWKKTKEEVFGA